jgi:F0F1-type ATP synthase delta subunit
VNNLPHPRNSSLVARTESDVAHLRVAVPLTEDERQRLHHILEDYFGHDLELQVEEDPDVLAGVFVQVGDTAIDGSLRGKLDALHHHLLTQSRIMISSQFPSDETEDLA